jgi:hypothetical protein
MAANTNYNDPNTISRVISIIQDMNPDKEIGEYVRHAPSERGVRVELTNGYILVTLVAIEDVDHAYSVDNYSDFMVTTFEPKNQG